jgi:hypothetical protein
MGWATHVNVSAGASGFDPCPQPAANARVRARTAKASFFMSRRMIPSVEFTASNLKNMAS